MYREPIQLSSNEVIEYLRKSRSDDPLLTVGEVLERHEKILDDFASRNFGDTVPPENVYREVASSETIDGRPEMLKLLKAVESPKIKAVLVVEVQRLSRGDLEDAGRLIKLLRYTNTMVVTPQRPYDLQDEYDRDAFERELKRGNEYLEYFKKIQERGRLQSVMEGNYIGSVPPYGYDKTFVKIGKKKCPTLTENKPQADVVRLIFDLYANKDMGVTRICNYLEGLAVPPPKGKYWSPYAVREMLINVHYIGKIKWNWRKGKIKVVDQEIVRTRPKAKEGDYITVDGRHEGIVDERLFYAAQEKHGRNHRAKPSAVLRNPLAGLLFCKCGRAMTLRTYKGRTSLPRFICDGQTHCKTGSATFDEIFDAVCISLEKHIRDFQVRLDNGDDATATLHENMIQNLKSRLDELEQREIRQWEKYTEESMPKSIFDALNEKVIKEKETTRKALQKAAKEAPAKIDYRQQIARFSEALETLKNPEIPAETKNKYLKNIIDRIEYTRKPPVRITKKNREQFSASTHLGGNWHSYPFELDIRLKF